MSAANTTPPKAVPGCTCGQWKETGPHSSECALSQRKDTAASHLRNALQILELYSSEYLGSRPENLKAKSVVASARARIISAVEILEGKKL